jgi:hypothetical protein
VQRIVYGLLLSALLLAAGCGGGGHSSGTIGNISVAGGNTIVHSGNNVAPLIVDAGPVPAKFRANVPFTTVVVCAPGTSNCVTIDHVGVDTGSTGLRIPASLLTSLNLQNVNSGTPVAECVQFLDGSFFWGTVKSADVKMGGATNTGELAGSVPIHVMGDPSVSSIPGSCTGTEEDTVAALGENGLLGVGNFQFDCDVLGIGNPCTSSSTVPPGTYFSCSGLSCSVSAVPTSQQVRNPVSKFAMDNNGVILELPAVPVGGQTGISAGEASMVFGIGTQSNNGLGGAVVLALDPNPNDVAWMGITTVFNGVLYPHSTSAISSFLDSGSNGLFFLDEPTSAIPSCGPWYCPVTTETLMAVNKATGGNSRGVQFDVSNANTLFSHNGGNSSAFSDLAGPNTAGTPDSQMQIADGYFDWGLPFFYGRNVYTAIWGVTPPGTAASGSSVPAGPFWAY